MTTRVVFYGMNYAPELAGVGRYTGDLCTHFADRGHDVCIVTTPPHYPGWQVARGYSNRRWRREWLRGVHVFRCPIYLNREMRGVRRLLAPASFALSSAPVVIWQIIRRRPHLVVVVEPTLLAAPAALLAAKLVGARTVLHVQDLEADAAFAVGHLGGRRFARAAAWFDRQVKHRFDRVITIAERMRDRIVARGVAMDRVEIVRNWVDVAQIVPLDRPSKYRSQLGFSDHEFVVLYAGNLGVKQGLRLILDAAQMLAAHSRVRFVIAGDGPLRPAVEAASRTLPNLHLLPFQPEADFAEFLGLADLHVLPQERGAADLVLPSKLGGMLASGKPIVVTADRDTELAAFLGDSCRFVPPGDATALATAIEQALVTGVDPGRSERLSLAVALDKQPALARFEALALEQERPS